MSTKSYLLRTSLALACVGIGAGAVSGVADAAAAKTVLKTASVSISVNGKTTKQSVLVNGSGHAVYLLTGDSSKHPECTSSGCLGDWPAVTSSSKKPALGKGVTGKVAIWRHGGINQVTINGHPLYTYAGDSGAGVADGEGLTSFGGTWKVLTPAGGAAAIKSSSASTGGSGSGW